MDAVDINLILHYDAQCRVDREGTVVELPCRQDNQAYELGSASPWRNHLVIWLKGGPADFKAPYTTGPLPDLVRGDVNDDGTIALTSLRFGRIVVKPSDPKVIAAYRSIYDAKTVQVHDGRAWQVQPMYVQSLVFQFGVLILFSQPYDAVDSDGRPTDKWLADFKKLLP